MKRVLIINHQDSFVYNLERYVLELGFQAITVDCYADSTESFIYEYNPSHIILSPGPGKPENASLSIKICKEYTIPILGVCLGHQIIGIAAGADVSRAAFPMHGKKSEIKQIKPSKIFKDIQQKMYVGRYHSLIIQNTPKDYITTSICNMKQIMSIEHKNKPIYGVQFHPESILTEHGKTIIKNFLENQS